MNTLDILRKFIIELENEFIPSIGFSEDGYQSNFRLGGKSSYAKRIGEEFIKHKISFSSLYDIGYGKFDTVGENPEFQERYVNSCKQTPNYIFLQNILPHNEQKDFLLKLLNKFDLSLCFDNPMGIERISNDNFSKLNSVFAIFTDLRTVGVDKVNINEEITNIIKKHYINEEVNNPNIVINFINAEFSFDKEFMETVFKKSFFTHFIASQKDGYDNLCCCNNENRIKFNYNDIDSSLPLNEDRLIKKNKI